VQCHAKSLHDEDMSMYSLKSAAFKSHLKVLTVNNESQKAVWQQVKNHQTRSRKSWTTKH